MSYNVHAYEVPRSYLLVSQLSSCLAVAAGSSFIDRRYWVVALGAAIGWIAQPLFVQVATSVVGQFVPRPDDEGKMQEIWITRVMPIALVLLGVVGLISLAVLFMRLTAQDLQGGLTLIAIVIVASLLLSSLWWVRRSV